MKTLRDIRNKIYAKAKENPEMKFYSLRDKICREDTIREAWRIVSSNKGSPGIDGMTIEWIKEEGVDRFVQEIVTELKEDRYEVQNVKRVFIPKPDGKERPLGIPTVKDRVVQTAVKLIIEPIFEADFKDFSFGYRPNRSARDASMQIYKWLNFGLTNVIEIDIKGFFDHIDHDLLIDLVMERVTDGFVLRLLRKWLRAGVMLNGTREYPQEGTPQGGSISPLLANIYLNSIDRTWVAEKMNAPKYNAQMVRYADDIVILTDREPSIAMNKIEEMIHSAKLSLNTEKSGITDARNGFDFLGFNFTRRYYEKAGKQVTRMRPSKRSAERFREKVKLILSLRRAHHSSQEDTVKELNLLIMGWTNYFNHTQASGTYHRLQAFLNWKLEKYYRRKHKIPRSYTHIVYNSLPKLGVIPLSGRISYVYP